MIFRKVNCSGFTLIEIMVVMVIIGIIMSMAVLSINLNQSTILEDEVNRLRSLTLMASEEAVMQGEELAVQMHVNGYQFLRLLQTDQAWQWEPVSKDDLFRPRCFPPGLEMKLDLEGESAILDRMQCRDGQSAAATTDEEDEDSLFDDEEKKELPKVYLLSSGELTPFAATLTWEEEGEYVVVGELTGYVISYDAAEKKDDF